MVAGTVAVVLGVALVGGARTPAAGTLPPAPGIPGGAPAQSPPPAVTTGPPGASPAGHPVPVTLRRAPLVGPGADPAITSPAVTRPEPPVGIMPLGDSITRGHSVPGGWRLPLTRRLHAAGIRFDLVGSQAHGPPGMADPDHEGHPGWRIRDLAWWARRFLTAHPADVVLVAAGTNDLYLDDDPDAAPDRLSTLLDEIRAAAPGAVVVVATVGPFADPRLARAARALNAGLRATVAARAAVGEPVVLVDLAARLDPRVHLIDDGIHPDREGYRRIADGWAEVLVPLLGGSAPSRT